MPVTRATPESRRRVRTGCLTCRKRRRKCDERKPRCTTCEDKGFSCRYPELTFVSAPKEAPSGADDASGRKASTYSSITFVDDAPPTPASRPGDRKTRQDDLPRPASSSRVVPRAASQTPGGSTTDPDPAWTPSAARASTKTDHPLSTWDSYFSTKHVSPDRREAALLRHFRYKMAPWIEGGDPASQFGVDVMRLAQDAPPIHAAVLAISSRQFELISEGGRGDAGPAYRQEARGRLFGQDGHAGRVAEALMALDGFLDSSPSMWRNLPLFELKDVSGDGSVFTVEEPLQTLYRLHARIDLAASILAGQPPLTSLAFHSPNLIHAPAGDQSAKTVYNWSLYHLTICLHFIHDNLQPSSFPPLQLAQPLAAPATFSAQWFSLWTSCQAWYDRRPLMMKPILDIRSLEAAQIDPDDRSAFPIQVYTTAIALQANVVYHATSLLLLSRKPRLLKLPPHQRYAASQGWHAQNIAGIATRNDFAEQWDPILVAALLVVAREMTHRSQQEALLACFRTVTASTGIKLGREICELQSGWTTARCYESSTA